MALSSIADSLRAGMSVPSSIWRLTLNIIPNAIAVHIIDEPPCEISGRFCPVSGMKLIVTMICSRACIVISSASPSSSSPANIQSQLPKMRIAR